MLNNLENYVWRYNSAVELVNLIFLYIEQNALKVSTPKPIVEKHRNGRRTYLAGGKLNFGFETPCTSSY